ncbi:MAG: transglycosylase SLT domain-containing protein [Bdellovibrionales bacterium]|nr:transglycosylase SLT domain-containing protein [Bdellovibrionales bacterium]
MKIDFLGRYGDVSRLLDAPTKQVAEEKLPSEFATLLGDISPFKPKEPKIIEEKELIQPKIVAPKPKEESPMARFNFPLPELKMPGLEPIKIAPKLPEPVNPPEVSVKTPEGVIARRIKIEKQALHELPKPERISSISKLVNEFGVNQGIDPLLGMAVVGAESNYNPLAVSSDGHESKGLFQLLDSTGNQLFTENNLEGEYDPFNPEQNVKLGVSYLRKLHDIFSSSTKLPNNLSTVAAANSSSLEKLAVAAFNAGEGRVASAQERALRAGMNPADYDSVSIYLPESTQEYVQKVFSSKLKFEAEIESKE